MTHKLYHTLYAFGYNFLFPNLVRHLLILDIIIGEIFARLRTVKIEYHARLTTSFFEYFR